MLKRLSTALLLGGLLGLVPTAAGAAPAPPADATEYGSHPAQAYDLTHHDDGYDDHYRCWYHCDDRYYHRRYRDRQRYCWYHDDDGWYRARCHRYRYGWDDDDSFPGDGGYDSHREHNR